MTFGRTLKLAFYRNAVRFSPAFGLMLGTYVMRSLYGTAA